MFIVTDLVSLTMTTYPEDESDSVGISVVVSISGSVVESLSIKCTYNAAHYSMLFVHIVP